jgi:hypothetical protein
MMSISLVGYSKSQTMQRNTDVLSSLNLGLLTIIIIVAAAATVFTSFLGALGAYLKNMLLLKLYVVLVLITFLTQLTIGAYMLHLDMSALRTSWEQDDNTGLNRRITLQNYLICCGFDIWSDSMGALHTNCPFLPTYPAFIEPTACYPAARSFVSAWLNPIAVGAIVIGLIESIAMCITFALIFKSKDRNSDTAFDRQEGTRATMSMLSHLRMRIPSAASLLSPSPLNPPLSLLPCTICAQGACVCVCVCVYSYDQLEKHIAFSSNSHLP